MTNNKGESLVSVLGSLTENHGLLLTARHTTDVDAGQPLNVLNYDTVRPFSTQPPDPVTSPRPVTSDATAPPPSYDEVVTSNIYELPANNRNIDFEVL